MYSNVASKRKLVSGKTLSACKSNKILTLRTIEQWDRLPREVMEFFLLKVFMTQPDKANLIYGPPLNRKVK